MARGRRDGSGWLKVARNVHVTVRVTCNRCDTFRNRPPHSSRRTRRGMRNILGSERSRLGGARPSKSQIGPHSNAAHVLVTAGNLSWTADVRFAVPIRSAVNQEV